MEVYAISRDGTAACTWPLKALPLLTTGQLGLVREREDIIGEHAKTISGTGETTRLALFLPFYFGSDRIVATTEEGGVTSCREDVGFLK